jgi:chemotaxis protein MotB
MVFGLIYSKQINHMKTYIIILVAGIFTISSCVPKRLLRQSESNVAKLQSDSAALARRISETENHVQQLQSERDNLNKKISELNDQNNALGQQTSLQKNQLNMSKEELAKLRERSQQLEQLLEQQKKQTQDLKAKMSEALNSFNSNELTVTQKNGKVYVSLSEGLLFPSGSAVVNPRGTDALAKLAAVLNLNPDISVNIEGHTDSIPIRGRYKDNWDLSTARANAIVRILTDNYKVDPVRVEASGHSKYDPVDVNSTPEGRARNRRTEIILSPKLDEMYKLLEQ